MKYVQITTHADGWGKTLLFDKHRALIEEGNESYVFWARGRKTQNANLKKIGNIGNSVIDYIQSRIDGKAGFHSKRQTLRLLKELDLIHPDIVHLHVLTGYYINVEMLFNWLKSSECKVIWTQHDCWAFTGHCIHYTMSKCSQWKSECGVKKCPNIKEYPPALCKNSVKWNFMKKKELFTQIPMNRMKLIAPSYWMKSQLEQSFLSKYEIEVIHNKVDKTIFRHLTDKKIKEVYGVSNKFIILGVAGLWSYKKGLDDFYKLSRDIDKNSLIILVGINNRLKNKISRKYPNIHCIEKTSNIDELVELYNVANILFNPTKEDNYPTVNLEAEACGLPVVTYNVGGCSETIQLKKSKCVSGYNEAIQIIKEFEMNYQND